MPVAVAAKGGTWRIGMALFLGTGNVWRMDVIAGCLAFILNGKFVGAVNLVPPPPTAAEICVGVKNLVVPAPADDAVLGFCQVN